MNNLSWKINDNLILLYNRIGNEFILICYELDEFNNYHDFYNYPISDYTLFSDEELFQESTIYNYNLPLPAAILIQEKMKSTYGLINEFTLLIDNISYKVKEL